MISLNENNDVIGLGIIFLSEHNHFLPFAGIHIDK